MAMRWLYDQTRLGCVGKKIPAAAHGYVIRVVNCFLFFVLGPEINCHKSARRQPVPKNVPGRNISIVSWMHVPVIGLYKLRYKGAYVFRLRAGDLRKAFHLERVNSPLKLTTVIHSLKK